MGTEVIGKPDKSQVRTSDQPLEVSTTQFLNTDHRLWPCPSLKVLALLWKPGGGTRRSLLRGVSPGTILYGTLIFPVPLKPTRLALNPTLEWDNGSLSCSCPPSVFHRSGQRSHEGCHSLTSYHIGVAS